MSTTSAPETDAQPTTAPASTSLSHLRRHLAKLTMQIEETISRLRYSPSEPLDLPWHAFPKKAAENVPGSSDRASLGEIPGDRLTYLASAMGLSLFEQQLILLCAGFELDSNFASQCVKLGTHQASSAPTFHMASLYLPGAHLSALSPEGPLRSWRVLELSAADSISHAPLKLDERILFFLSGSDGIDERLSLYLQVAPAPTALPEAYHDIARRMIECWMQPGPAAMIQLDGSAADGKTALTVAVAQAVGLKPLVLRTVRLPASTVERQVFCRLCQRETLLQRLALICVSDTTAEVATLNHTNLSEVIDLLDCPVVAVQPIPVTCRPVLRLQVDRLDAQQQCGLWEHAVLGVAHDEELGDRQKLRIAMHESFLRIANQFSFAPGQIQQIAQSCLADPQVDSAATLSARLWQECRYRANAQLSGLAQSIATRATWNDLIVSEDVLDTLHQIAAQVRQSTRVHQHWGFASNQTRGLGVTALLEGPSGTGKTLAAEVLANELSLDLFRIDLSQVISKYIGETEKNLSTIFDAAENSGAILLFDEADALFGKRSEVKDSHDRYANIEVSYLLQRMEAYRGLALLTTNHRHALDGAFLRRITFIIPFGFPDAEQRERIWRNIWPASTPIDKLDFAKLARLNVTGGSIRNIALSAAFLAADAAQPVSMHHLLKAARSECRKIEKGLTSAEIGGWL